MKKAKGPWQAWVAAGLTAASTVLYVAVVSSEGIAEGDLGSIITIASTLALAAVLTAQAALVSNRQLAMGLLGIALVPLVIWGVLGAWTIGGLFLLSAVFVGFALWSMSRNRPENDVG